MEKDVKERVGELLRVMGERGWYLSPGMSDWGLPRSLDVVLDGGDPYEDRDVVARVPSVTPYCLGASSRDLEWSRRQGATAEFISISKLVVVNLLRENAALTERIKVLEGG